MSRKRYLQIVDYDELQHYKDRNPIWIKLHCALLDQYEFAQIPDETKFHAVGLMLLAARLNNKFPDDEAWLRQKINANSEIDLNLLLEIKFLSIVSDEKNSQKKQRNARKPNKTQGEPASAISETALAQNRTEQKRKEQNTTQQNTTQQTRPNADADAGANAPDAESGVVVCVDFENSKTENRKPAGKNGHQSEFSISEILKYVRLCAEKGAAIKNPQGLAANLYQTGNADAFIRAALYPEQQKEIDREIYGEPRPFTRDPCTVCFGAKMSNTDGKGYRKCAHCKDERGKSTGLEPEEEEAIDSEK
jgi:hypothetical protein